MTHSQMPSLVTMALLLHLSSQPLEKPPAGGQSDGIRHAGGGLCLIQQDVSTATKGKLSLSSWFGVKISSCSDPILYIFLVLKYFCIFFY